MEDKYVVLADWLVDAPRGAILGVDELPAAPDALITDGSIRAATADEAQLGHVPLHLLTDEHAGSTEARDRFARYADLIAKSEAANPQRGGRPADAAPVAPAADRKTRRLHEDEVTSHG